MDPKAVLRILGGLRVLRYFPNDEAAMNALMQLCGSMCSTIEQVEWLVKRMTSGIYAEWPGPSEMRACFCCRHKPKDGVNAYSQVYPEGLPPDPTAPPRSGIAAADLKRLPAGHTETADPELEAEVHRLAKKLEMPPAPPAVDRFARMLANITHAPEPRRESEEIVNPNFTPVTQADIDRAVAERRQKAAEAAAQNGEPQSQGSAGEAAKAPEVVDQREAAAWGLAGF